MRTSGRTATSKVIAATCTGTLAATLLVMSGAPAAHAAECGGERVRTATILDHVVEEPVARVDLYYSAADGGTTCVITRDKKPGAHRMGAYLKFAKSTEWKRNVGTYEHHTQPVKLKGTRGRKMTWQGMIQINGQVHKITRTYTQGAN